MRTTKLTLSADKELIEEAKKLAEKAGTSLSSMFARFLGSVLREENQRASPGPGPITKRATGLVNLPAGKTDRERLEEALCHKYGLRP